MASEVVNFILLMITVVGSYVFYDEFIRPLSQKELNCKLLCAAQEGSLLDIISAIKNKAHIHARNYWGENALMLACGRGDATMATFLLEKGADIHAKCDRGNNALMLACKSGDTATVTLLLEKGADIHAKNNWSENALMPACKSGHTATATLLLEKGVDIDAKDNSGINALMLACESGHTATVTLLLENGADIHAKYGSGINALMLACENGYTATAAFLLKKGAADIHAKCGSGTNALMLACKNGYTATAAFLLEKGADIHATNNEGKNALILAFESCCIKTFNLLLSYQTPEKRDAFSTQSNLCFNLVNDFKASLKTNALVSYNKIRHEQWNIGPTSIFNLLPTELLNYIRSLEASLDLKEKFKDSWYLHRVFVDMALATKCCNGYIDKPIFPVLFLSNTKKAQSEPVKNHNANKMYCSIQ